MAKHVMEDLRTKGKVTRAQLGVSVQNVTSDMKPVDLVQGTLDLLILKSIALEPLHGWAIAARIRQLSNDVRLVQQGSLYPALQRLEHQGWITAKWGISDQNRRAKFYSLTKAGRKQLDREAASWERLAAAITLVVNAT